MKRFRIIIKRRSFGDIEKLIGHQHSILDLIVRMKKKQVKYIKAEMVGTRNTLLYLNLLAESKNLVCMRLIWLKLTGIFY